MTQAATIHAFTKPDCNPCARAKAILDQADLSYTEHDVTAAKRDADASVYFSGVATLPQIFIGAQHVNGSKDLARLGEGGRIDELLRAANGSKLPLDQVSDEELANGAEDVPLTRYIPQSDGSRDSDPGMWPLNRFYQQWFGFYPNSFLYMHNYPEALKLFVYGHTSRRSPLQGRTCAAQKRLVSRAARPPNARTAPRTPWQREATNRLKKLPIIRAPGKAIVTPMTVSVPTSLPSVPSAPRHR